MSTLVMAPTRYDLHGESKYTPPDRVPDVHDSADSFTYILPPRPNPSADAGLSMKVESGGSNTPPSPNSLDVFTIGPITALKLLCAGMEALVKVTGDVPPTPPPTCEACKQRRRTLYGAIHTRIWRIYRRSYIKGQGHRPIPVGDQMILMV
jgi:hypothetical protein